MTIYFATRDRGFLRHLFNCKNIQGRFLYSESQVYEINSIFYNLLSAILHHPLGDFLGVIQVIPCKNKGDIYGSLNRFLNSDRPYFMYVETPIAPYHYCLNRNKTFWGKRNLLKNLHNKNLKALIFWSNACGNTFEEVCAKIPPQVIRETIYPYYPDNCNISVEKIKVRTDSPPLKLLYIAQGIRFITKGALEILETFKRLRTEGNNHITLTMITSIKEVDPDLIHSIKAIEGISLYDFKFTYAELEKIYASSSLLLHPTSDDSFGLTVLEAMKAGLPVISTRLYAIPEMVKEGVNGFLTDPHWWSYDSRNLPNPALWTKVKKKGSVFTRELSERIVSFLYDKIRLLDNDRALLEKMSLNSLHIASSPPFDKQTIIGQWNSLFDRMVQDTEQRIVFHT